MSEESAEPAHCTWTDFSLSDTEKLLNTSINDSEIQTLLVDKLGLHCFPAKQRLILLDLFTYTWLFGKKEGYKPDQMSTILTMVKRLHAKCTSTSRENLEDVLKYLQHLLVQHSVNRPPFSHSIFSLCQVKSITEFILSTYFKHYKLYKYAFTKKLHLNVTLTYAGEAELEEEKEEQPEEGVAASETTDGAGSATQIHADPVKLRLKEILSSKLTEVVEKQQASLKEQLIEEESKLLKRISTLEKLVSKKKPSSCEGGKKKLKS